ncbi:metallophosphoesterase family protein [Paenibacillus sp. SYP-B3998]|uniref:Metallophosphoesterase family protein n=1 Tax=Paenibacillus sp. SYP-B3998 TaxID=2678564 RepID=A0A6G4A2R6_9BACL|nr:metallophosphoesterase family protein [Paenibacillus sp. SYP-B3998]NEW08763.1 metallophosphoesterase family protein [Paenibacillus sp. SYP-B3998]
MDSVAIISDIHGNIPALDAVLQDIKRREITRIICLGDLVGKGPGSAEAVDRIKAVCENVVQGNWDLGITSPQDLPAGQWHQEQLGAERLAYLEQLPFSVDVRLSGKLIRLFHASAQSVFHRLKRKASKEERLAVFENTAMTGTPLDGRQPDIIGYGDIHIPYLLTIKSPRQNESTIPACQGLTLFNVGSVGTPYDGNPQACYCIVEGETDSSVPAGLSIQFVRVPYDIELAVRLAYEVEMPDRRRYELEITSGLVHK